MKRNKIDQISHIREILCCTKSDQEAVMLILKNGYCHTESEAQKIIDKENGK